MNKTDKSNPLHALESTVKSDAPENIDITIVDGMFHLHFIVNPPQSYDKLAEEVSGKLCNMANRVDYVCDTYIIFLVATGLISS